MSEVAENEVKPKKTPAKKAAAPAKKAPAKKAVAAKEPKSKPLPKSEKAPKAEKPAKAEKKPKAPKEPKAPADRSAAVSATWSDPEVKAARNLKSKVKVGGVEYGSTLKAFITLKLPVNKHIAFRAELKAAGKATFKDEATGTKYNFVLVPPAEAA